MCSIPVVEDHKIMAETLVRVLPRTSGIELVSMIQQKYPGLPCLMISGRSAGQYLKRSLAAGARRYVLKDDFQDVMKGIRRVLKDGRYLSKQLSREE
jgi:DNA-binding NarL/FixJ family response regulator